MTCAKTDEGAVLLAVANVIGRSSGDTASMGEVIEDLRETGAWEEVWRRMGHGVAINLSAQNIGSRMRRLEKHGVLVTADGRSAFSMRSRYRFASPEDTDKVEAELREKCAVSDDERLQVEGIANDAEVTITLSLTDEIEKDADGEWAIGAVIVIESNKARAERSLAVTRRCQFSWVDEIDRFMSE